MKAGKTVLAFAIMMVVLMPSCKKEDISIYSKNPYISIFAAGDNLIGKNKSEAERLLTNEGWELADTCYKKSVNDLVFTIYMRVGSESNKVGYVEGNIFSEKGKTDLFSEKNYSNFIVALDKAHTLNGDKCEFQSAYYQINNEKTTYDNFKDLKKDLKNFIKADATMAYWGTREPCEFNIHTRFECQRFVFTCRFTDTRQKIVVEDHSDE